MQAQSDSMKMEILGIDGGGTQLRWGRVNVLTGAIRDYNAVPMPDSIGGIIKAIPARDYKLQIGIGIAGGWDDSGIFTHSPNNQFLLGKNLFAEMEQAYGVEVYSANDLKVAGRGCMVSADPNKIILVITWSTGINSCVIYKGILLGGETGHILFDDLQTARKCGCERHGCVEAYAGGTNVALMVKESISRMPQREQERLWAISDDPNCILDAAYGNEELWAEDLYMEDILPSMGHLLSTVHNVAPYDEIWWMGSFAKGALRLEGIEEALRGVMAERMVRGKYASTMPFKWVPNDAPIKGAALNAYDEINKAA